MYFAYNLIFDLEIHSVNDESEYSKNINFYRSVLKKTNTYFMTSDLQKTIPNA